VDKVAHNVARCRSPAIPIGANDRLIESLSLNGYFNALRTTLTVQAAVSLR